MQSKGFDGNALHIDRGIDRVWCCKKFNMIKNILKENARQILTNKDE